MKELSNFDVVVDVIPDGLEKYMAFIINRNLVFIDSMQIMNSSLDSLVRNLVDKDFKYLSKEFENKCFKLLEEEKINLLEYISGFKSYVTYKFYDTCLKVCICMSI